MFLIFRECHPRIVLSSQLFVKYEAHACFCKIVLKKQRECTSLCFYIFSILIFTRDERCEQQQRKNNSILVVPDGLSFHLLKDTMIY